MIFIGTKGLIHERTQIKKTIKHQSHSPKHLLGFRATTIFFAFTYLTCDFFPGDAILFADPFAQINQLATLRTERAKGIVLPLDTPFTRRTVHNRIVIEC